MALAEWQGAPVTVRYRSFFLNPDVPADGYNFREYLQAKGGGRVPLEQWFEAPRRMGAAVGLTFNFEAIDRAPNSLLSHRLIAVTPADRQKAVIDAIYAAYFEHGRDIGDLDVLLAIAADHGLDRDQIRTDLAGPAALETVLADVNYARQAGIGGVPFFIFNERYAFSGAQPPDVILRVMAQVAAADDTPTPGEPPAA